ncbi:hypothetical protein, partial [Klebsiella pneumoniae]|uniref:hypothetical protein n=1 Tax=Klebsiella pneumoniae TaxID=573 RepID=UPI0027311095
QKQQGKPKRNLEHNLEHNLKAMPSENPCSDGIPFCRNGQSETTDWAIISFLRIPRDSKGKTMYEVNRSVFVLIPLEPFWNWLQT